MLNQCSVPPTDPPPKPDSTTMLDPLRRQSLGVLKQLESCHIGTRESKDYVVRRNSLPIAPSATVSLPKGHVSWLPNSSYGAVQAVQHSSHSTSIPWWNESRSLTQTNTANLPDWRPLQMDNSVSKKRRREDELTTGQAQRLSQSSQISPQTSPVSTLPNIESSARDSVIDTSEMLWTPDMPSLSGNQPSNLPMFNSWADFDWNAFDRLGTSHCEPPPVHQTIPMNHTVPSTQKPANLLYQPRVGQSKSRNTWQQNISRVPAPQAPYRPIFKSSQTSQRFQTSLHQPRHQQSVSPRSTMPMKATIPSFQQPATLSRNFNGNPPNLSSPHLSLQPQRKQTTVSPSQTQTIPQSLQVASSDLMRKPSLYKIPAWPSPLEVRPPQMHMMTSQFQARPPNSNPDRSAGSQSSMNFGTLRQPSNSMPPERQSSRNFDDTPHSRGMNPAGSTHAISVAKINTFELPQARTGRKHCPNLYELSSALISLIR
jgi:hypothetical protein